MLQSLEFSYTFLLSIFEFFFCVARICVMKDHLNHGLMRDSTHLAAAGDLSYISLWTALALVYIW